MRNLIVDCNGGTCNRLGNILLGHYLREKWSFDRIFVNWPRQFSCDARFRDCFQSPYSHGVFESDQGDGRRAVIEYFDNQIRMVDEYMFPQYTMEEGNYLLISKDIDKSIPHGDLLILIRNYLPQPVDEIREAVSSFVNQHGIDSTWLGVHCRRTDRDNINNEYYLQEIGRILDETPHLRFFVCSDCCESERLIQQAFPQNVVIRQKQRQPEPIIDQPGIKRFIFDDAAYQRLVGLGWKDNHYAENAILGRKEKYNIYRSRGAVQEGICDLLILSQVRNILRSVGSYFRLASALIESREATEHER